MAEMYCSNCGAKLTFNDLRCLKCGSLDKCIKASDSIAIDDIREHLRETLDKELYSGKHKYSYEVKIKPDFDRDTQQSVIVTQTFNRRKDCDSAEKTYIEEIRTKSGELIKGSTDELSEHKGHGSDRKNRKRKDFTDGGGSDA